MLASKGLEKDYTVVKGMRVALLFVLGLVPLGLSSAPEFFAPAHRLSGIGVDRDDLSDDLLDARTDLMIQSQTFAIMRDPRAVTGAKRITGDAKLQAMFRAAAERSGLPASLLEAISYLESWGDPNAESPSGPRGIMQISLATAREMGLRILHITRYKMVTEKVQVKNTRGKLVTKTIRHKVAYSVPSRDERLIPERAIPAAANYLANLERRYGARDWAIFAYHCGEGCAAEMLDLTRRARGIPKDRMTVARMFFSCSPAWNRELYQAIQLQMQRDYSPTYWFRVQKAQQLLDFYRRDPNGFQALAQEYKSDFGNGVRAPHRLSVWLKRDDLLYRSCEDIKSGMGTRLVKAFERPEYFGYTLRLTPDLPENLEYFSQASPSAVGTLTYIAYETRRLWEEMKVNGENYKPLEVTSLVEPEDYARTTGQNEGLSHCSGEVFDIAYGGLPPGEYECLRFVLDDLGWEGYLGFVEEGRDSMHIGCAPAVRDFFTTVFQEALGKMKPDDSKDAVAGPQ
jgi:Transglycosylase SLT domain